MPRTTLTAALVSGPAHGSVTLNPDGSFTYTPAAGYCGADSFAYAASDGTGHDTANVDISVACVNDTPTAVDDAYAVDEDALTIPSPGVLGNDSDPDGDPLTATLHSGPSNGTVTLNADGSFTYTPAADFNGTDSFTYTASNPNGGTSNIATVTIMVRQVKEGTILDAKPIVIKSSRASRSAS